MHIGKQMNKAPSLTRRIGLLTSLSLLGWLVGCGSGGGYRVSGNVTFQGKPVPAGKIYFMPDSSKGNNGATGYADIKDGKYDTSAQGGQNAPAGAVLIAVEGTDPSAAPNTKDTSGEVTAKLLFARYEKSVELPTSSSTQDIDVPADAAKGPAAPKSKAIIP